MLKTRQNCHQADEFSELGRMLQLEMCKEKKLFKRTVKKIFQTTPTTGYTHLLGVNI